MDQDINVQQIQILKVNLATVVNFDNITAKNLGILELLVQDTSNFGHC